MPNTTAKPDANQSAAPRASAARSGAAEPILAYHPDAYEVARDDLKGRHSAGESFLSAFLVAARNPEALAITGRDEHFVAFEKAVKDARRPLLTARAWPARTSKRCASAAYVKDSERIVLRQHPLQRVRGGCV